MSLKPHLRFLPGPSMNDDPWLEVWLTRPRRNGWGRMCGAAVVSLSLSLHAQNVGALPKQPFHCCILGLTGRSTSHQAQESRRSWRRTAVRFPISSALERSLAPSPSHFSRSSFPLPEVLDAGNPEQGDGEAGPHNNNNWVDCGPDQRLSSKCC